MQAFKRVGVPAVKLLLIPGLTEAFFDGGLGVAFFDMPVRAPPLTLRSRLKARTPLRGSLGGASPQLPVLPASSEQSAGSDNSCSFVKRRHIMLAIARLHQQ